MIQSISVNFERGFSSKRIIDICKTTAKRISKIAVPLISIVAFSSIPTAAASSSRDVLRDCIEECSQESLRNPEHNYVLCVILCYSSYAFGKFFG